MTIRKVGRPARLGSSEDVHIRLPSKLLEELDAWLDNIRSSHMGASGASRSDLIRDILQRAVEERLKQVKV